MKFAIYTTGAPYCDKRDIDMLLLLSEKYDVSVSFNLDFAQYVDENFAIKVASYSSLADLDADMMITYGGDGTFLHCVAFLEDKQIPIMGVNSGRLGFLSSITRPEVENALNLILKGEYSIDQRSMIEVSGDFGCDKVYPHVFNEFTVQKSELNMIRISIDVNNQNVATFAADGMIVSTPTGSTAYSLSSGGAIMVPGCGAFIITPIAAHNLTVRPIIVSEKSHIKITVYSHIDECYATLDNRSYKVKDGATFNLSLSPNKANIVQFKDGAFFDTLRKKLMWASETKRG